MARVKFELSTRSAKARQIICLLFALEDGDNIVLVDCPQNNRFVELTKRGKQYSLEELTSGKRLQKNMALISEDLKKC